MKDNLTRDKMRIYVSIAAVVVLSFLVFIGVYTLLDSTARADVARRNEEADVLLEAAESASEESAAEEKSAASHTGLLPRRARESGAH